VRERGTKVGGRAREAAIVCLTFFMLVIRAEVARRETCAFFLISENAA